MDDLDGQPDFSVYRNMDACEEPECASSAGQRIYAGYVGAKALRTNLCTIHVSALAASNMFIRTALCSGSSTAGKSTVNSASTDTPSHQSIHRTCPSDCQIKDIVSGLVTSMARAVRYWFHYTLVAFAWLGVVPLTACRIYRCLFTGSVSSLLTLPLDMLSTENLASDCFQGCFVVTCTLCAFISLVWLREQILHGGGPDWLEQDNQAANQARNLLDGGAVNNLIGGLAGGHRAPANNAQPNNAPAAEEPMMAEEEVDDVEPENDGIMDGDDNNWNPIEWDRAAEELTWERLLGLDGSLVFLEHVFWVVSLNTLFILVFAFSPYHIGHFTLVGIKLDELIAASHFEGLLTTLVGYLVIAVSFMTLYILCSFARLKKFRRVLGLCYVVVKVKLLVVMEIGVFPLICGWWLDICSLSMFEASLKDRKSSFHLAPGTSMFIHWLVGMVYVFYFASFILLLREVLRPGVLWFLRNLNDPEFNPIQEMIHLPVHRHIRRFVASVIIFGSTVLLMLWLPVRVIRKVFVGFLPYHVMLSSDAPVSELSLELLLLQVVLPALLEQGHTRQWLKRLVAVWTVGVAWLLDLRSYLIGDVQLKDGDNVIRVEEHGPAGDGAGAGANNAAPAPQDLGEGLVGFQPYKRPSFFVARVFCLVLLMCVTLFAASLLSLTVPVFIGRKLMSVWMGDSRIHELYTAACGLYICWLILRISTVLYNWIPQGGTVIAHKLKEWALLALKSLFVAFVLIGVVPLLLGLLFELVVVAPLRVPLDQSPVFFPWQDWALGVLHAKIICAITMMGPQWWLKRVMEQVYNDGLRNMNLCYILNKLCLPVVCALGMMLAIPYIIAKSLVPALGIGFELQNMVLRRIYPFLVAVMVSAAMLVFQVRQFRRLYNHIKDDKYLVGQRLVNYMPVTQTADDSAS
ncbi:hypothetical protein BaRGS_00033227 [Batillaria attramentaria]|uniref:RING-type E3 ubiquitin transferase n=1 Tax=Batillaria attramentaria TaxID=370345 RepID=A0ABD0JKN7_9CAEN